MYIESIAEKLLKDEKRLHRILRIIKRMNFPPTHFVKELIDEHIKNIRRKRKTWFDIFEREHNFHMDFLGER